MVYWSDTTLTKFHGFVHRVSGKVLYTKLSDNKRVIQPTIKSKKIQFLAKLNSG